jgi:anti-anti-sigma factor
MVGRSFSSEGAFPPLALELLMYPTQSFDAQPPLRVTVRCGAHGEPASMAVFGDLDAVTADRLQDAVADLLSRHRPRLISMDMAGVPFLDSAGIRALLRSAVAAEQVGSALTLAELRPTVYRVLQISGLLDHFGVTEPQPSDARRPATAGGPQL